MRSPAPFDAPPVDPIGATQSVASRARAEPVEFPEGRAIVAFAARMHAVEDMLSTVERSLPPELDVAAACAPTPSPTG